MTIHLHPAAEQTSAAIADFTERLAKIGEAMDVVIAAEGENVRPALERLAERLIAFLDATTPDPDLEDADAEPLLGVSEIINQERAWKHPIAAEAEGEDIEGDELDPGEISDLEYHGENDTDGSGTVDDEPSLGSLDGRMSQLRWSQPDRPGRWRPDIEHDEADPAFGGIDDDELELEAVQ